MFFTVDRNDPNFMSDSNDKFLSYSGPGSTPLSAAFWNALFRKEFQASALTIRLTVSLHAPFLACVLLRYRPIWGIGVGLLILLCDNGKSQLNPLVPAAPN